MQLNDQTEDATEAAVKEMNANAAKSRCDTMAYKFEVPAGSKLYKDDDVNLNYGSASLKGKMMEDKVCLDPNGVRCASKVSFLALYDAQGLGTFDGILGLSNHHSESKKGMNFVQQLKESGVIKNALISFDVNQNSSTASFG